jgi:hypothetical protein
MSRKYWIVAYLILAIGLSSLAFLQPSVRAQATSPYIVTITSDTPDPSSVGQRVTVRATVKSADGTPAQCVSVRVTNGVNSCTLLYNRIPAPPCPTYPYSYCYLTFPTKGKYVITASAPFYLGSPTDTELHTVVK